MKNRCINSIEQHQDVLAKVKNEMVDQIEDAAQMIIHALKQGHKLILCGNGGSAGDAQHIAAEFVGRFILERKSLPAISLTTDSSAITAIANDYGYENVFSRQFQGVGNRGDVLLAISTSGNSPNVLNAIKAAKDMNCPTIALTGQSGGLMKDVAEITLAVPSPDTPRIQEMHIMIGHIICDLVDQVFAK